MYYNKDMLCLIIKKIKSSVDVVIIFLIGERLYDEYKVFKDVGVDRFLMRFEILNRQLYEKYYFGMSFENRIECFKWIKSFGYEFGIGFLIGFLG